MILDGIVIGVGFLVLANKATHAMREWFLAHPFSVDAFVFILLAILHGGSATGVALAGVAALTVSIGFSCARQLKTFLR